MRQLTVSVPENVTLSGLVVAGVGFFMTRFTVTLAVYDDPAAFYLAGLVPLVLGLLLAAFGVALVVGPFDRPFVRTTTVWCLVGAGSMFLLVLLTLLGSNPGGVGELRAVLSETYLSNFLIGGSIGGTLTGVYAAQTERQRDELRWQANRLVTLNRILRHEVLNAITVIAGHADSVADRDGSPETDTAVEAIRRKSDRVVDTIDDVEHLTATERSAGTGLQVVDLVECIEASVESVQSRYPEAEYVLEGPDRGELAVWANPGLDDLVGHLVENAVVHNDAESPTVTVGVESDGRTVTVRVADDGPGLSDHHRSILEEGAIADHDDPSSGFGLNIVRLLVERFEGTVRATASEAGTTVEVTLLRADRAAPTGGTKALSYGVTRSKLAVAVGASLVAGVAMGLFTQTVWGSVTIIGALYGAINPVVGWITHEFHSVVFGMIYAALLTVDGRDDRGLLRCAAVGVAWGLFLWLFAQGVVMPIWLQLVGVSSMVPSLGRGSLASHLVWGVTLGSLYYAGTEWVESRVRSRSGANAREVA